jgi:RNA polymerase sigma-70 factor, ECF subfamily
VSLGPRFDEVLSAAVGGDRLGFAELWREHHPMLVRYLRVVCGDSAEDVASDTWVKAIGALGSFRGDEHGFRGWLVVIARNQARDVQRRDSRRREVLTGEPIEQPRARVADSADLAIENGATVEALRLVATLPPEQAELVMLRVVVGLDVADVARITGRTPGSVRVAVHRALRTLAGRVTPSLSQQAVTQPGPGTLGGRDV